MGSLAAVEHPLGAEARLWAVFPILLCKGRSSSCQQHQHQELKAVMKMGTGVDPGWGRAHTGAQISGLGPSHSFGPKDAGEVVATLRGYEASTPRCSGPEATCEAPHNPLRASQATGHPHDHLAPSPPTPSTDVTSVTYDPFRVVTSQAF